MPGLNRPLSAPPLQEPATLLCSPLLRQLERDFAGLPLMERAGASAAEWALALRLDSDAPVAIFAGPGNNGGDAIVTACLLRAQDVPVCVIGEATARRPADAAGVVQHFLDAGGSFARHPPGLASLVIDGLFGIGLRRAIAGPYDTHLAALQALAASSHCPLLALDTPSGLDADTGQCTGPTVRASHTLTFLADKPGLHTADGPDYAGEVRVASLGIDVDAWLADQGGIAQGAGWLVARDTYGASLVPRRQNTHKGSFGSAGILGGNHSMVGAALLAARAALKMGAGRVYLGLLDPAGPGVDPQQPELMFRTPAELLNAPLTALACGPGLGQDTPAADALRAALAASVPLVLDADALNLLAADTDLRGQLQRRVMPTVLTPHPSEAARLLDCETAGVQADRVRAACELARKEGAWVALKGCGTVVSSPDGKWWINSSGHPALASAGTGDVLTGMVASFLAQGWSVEPALLGAVHLHGAAAQAAVKEARLAWGLTASEVIDSARRLRNAWTPA